MRRILLTVNEVIDVLGGPRATHQVIGDPYGERARDRQTYQWRQLGRFPAKFHAVMTGALEREGFAADPALWGQSKIEAASHAPANTT